MIRLALVGDYSPHVVAHGAIPAALDLAARKHGVTVIWNWLGTDAIVDAPRQLAEYAGIWSVPGSPYRSMEGAINAIRYAREEKRPFLGTCGGFQHALVEMGRNLLRLPRADHAETYQRTANPMGFRVIEPDLVITPLASSLVGRQGEIRFAPGSRLDAICSGQPTRESYHCAYGPNPQFRERFEAAGLRFSGFDGEGQIRAFELTGHPFFLGTLYQPERAALAARSHPVVEAFVGAAIANLPAAPR